VRLRERGSPSMRPGALAAFSDVDVEVVVAGSAAVPSCLSDS